jgi:hypothetical protein
MSKYSTSKGPANSIRYRKDGRLISARDVPDNILQVLEHNPEFNEEQEAVHRDKSCIFCGQHSNATRMVNMRLVALCDKHYYSATLGEVVAKLRSNDGQDA